jgi:hypothetical protein
MIYGKPSGVGASLWRRPMEEGEVIVQDEGLDTDAGEGFEEDPEWVTDETGEEAYDEPQEVESVQVVDEGLTDDQTTALIASTVAEQCERIVNTLQNCEFDTKIEIYRQLDEVSQISYRWQCAILWTIRESAPHGESGGEEGILTEAAKNLGISYRTAMRKAQIWETFYQDPEQQNLTSPKRLWVFDELNNTESWFRLALMCENPEKAAEQAESRIEEARSTGGAYTPKMMKKDFDLLTDKERLRDAEAEVIKEREGEAYLSDVVVYWETNTDNGKTGIVDFLRDYFKTEKYLEGGCRPKRLFNSKTGDEIPF